MMNISIKYKFIYKNVIMLVYIFRVNKRRLVKMDKLMLVVTLLLFVNAFWLINYKKNYGSLHDRNLKNIIYQIKNK